MIEKDIERFRHGDMYLKQLIRLNLEGEVNNLNSWLPEYEQYYNTNPQDAIIGALIQKGREKLKTLKMLLEWGFYERILVNESEW